MEQDDEGNPIEGTGEVYPESAYTLTRVDEAGVNTITKYEYNEETQMFEPVYYEPALKHDISDTNHDRIDTDQQGQDVVGDFVGNYASDSRNARGGAIYNDSGTIGDITGNFIVNDAHSGSSSALGGAIYNYGGTIDGITGDFIGNHVSTSGRFASAPGGAIYNYEGTIGNITGDFIGNYASGSDAFGGAIYNDSGTIGDITGDFIGNCAQSGGSAYGGAIYVQQSGLVPCSLLDVFTETPYNIKIINSSFYNNYVQSSSRNAYGGAIYNQYGTIDDISGNFIGNYATTASETNLALGGAVYTNNNMTFSADNKTIGFAGNYTKDSRGEIPNAIFADTSYRTPIITLKAQNNGNIIFNDQIDGGTVRGTTIDRTTQYKLSLSGDKTGNIYLNNDIINADITLDEVTLNLGRDDVLNQSNTLALNSGVLNMVNGSAGPINIPNFSLNGTVNMSADVDLANETMDRIDADNYTVTEGSKLNVTNLHLLSDSTKDNISILFADKELAGNVEYTGVSPVAYSPIYKYDVEYALNPEDELGYFNFIRSAGSNPSDSFNPAVLSTPVTAQAGAYATQMQTFNYAFQHSDNFMNLPMFERLSLKESGRYASNITGGIYSPLLTRVESAGYWVKPYVSFESIPLKNGPKVSNIAYGSLIGFDSSLKPIKYGFDRVLTGYVGYNGASQNYSGVDSYQNGGLIGGTMTLYKNNFFNATTISAGASVGESYNMYGHDNFTMFLAGIANKFGYNFEFKNGRYIIQPSMLMSYTFVNTFDYTNAAGVNINSDPMHAIQLSPGVKFIMNTKTGWQPYVGVNMVWNVLDSQKVMANDVRLPEMSIKPYVQYGVGLQKKIKDRFLAFGQAMISNGGRNGVSLSFGLRWFIGK